MSTEPLTCLLCGVTERGVVLTWVRWTEEDDGKAFGTVHRCKDRAACHRRVEADGGTWEVDDGKVVVA